MLIFVWHRNITKDLEPSRKALYHKLLTWIFIFQNLPAECSLVDHRWHNPTSLFICFNNWFVENIYSINVTSWRTLKLLVCELWMSEIFLTLYEGNMIFQLVFEYKEWIFTIFLISEDETLSRVHLLNCGMWRIASLSSIGWTLRLLLLESKTCKLSIRGWTSLETP